MTFYKKYNPMMVKDVPMLLEKYEGKLEKQWLAINHKYLPRDETSEAFEEAKKEYPNLRVAVPQEAMQGPTQENLDNIRMQRGGRSFTTYMGSPPQAVIVKANPYDTWVNITQRNSGKVNITYVRSKEGVCTRIERGVRLDDVVEVSNDLIAMIIFLAEPDGE